MMQVLNYILLFAGGILAGIIFFGGLQLTIKYAVRTGRPALWFLLSFFIRAGITLAVIGFLSRGRWLDVLIMLAGFIVMRFVYVRRNRPQRPTERVKADATES